MTEEVEPVDRSQEPAYSYFDLARIPSFGKLWLGDIFSQSADRMAFVAITILAYGNGASALDLSLIIGAYFLPAVIVGIPGGIAADRFARRTTMVVAESARVAIALALALVGSGFWLIPTVLVFSSLTYLFYPSRQASIPCLVPERALMPANAAISANLILGFAIGPAIGGLIVTLSNPTWALVTAAGVMAVGVAIISTIRVEEVCRPVRIDGEGSSRVLREGLSALRGKAVLWQGLVMVGIVMFAVGGGAVALVVYGDEVLDMGKEGFSILLSALAMGTLVGAVFAGTLRPEAPRGILIVAGSAFAAWEFIGLSVVDDLMLAILVMVSIGISAAFVMVPISTLLQEQLGDHVMGTSFGVLSMGLTAPMIAGVVVAGPVIESAGVERLFAMLGVLLLAGSLVAFLWSELGVKRDRTPH
jgi:MFS family permease